MDYIENKIAETEKRVYNGQMPVENKSAMRSMLRTEERFEERREYREEVGHSHSAVGDWNGMREA